jgi:hypothetical protein
MSTPTHANPEANADFARAVAAELGPQWAPRPADWPGHYQLTDGRGARLVLLPGLVRGLLPAANSHRVRYGPSSPQIGVTHRDPVHVARHIRRRLLPQYEAARAQHQALVGAERAERRARARVAQGLAETLETPAATVVVVPDSPRSGQTTVRCAYINGGSVEAVVEGGGAGVSLDLPGLTADQANAVAGMVRNLNESRKRELTPGPQ